ncbi:MAG: CcmD family protein [Pirellulaceae bacterium]
MGTFIACYLIVWMAILLYVARLGITQTHMKRSLDRLQQLVDQQQSTDESAARAA